MPESVLKSDYKRSSYALICTREIEFITAAMVLHGAPFQLMLLVEILLTAATTATLVSTVAKPGCNDTCGDVKIPYPFGTKRRCYLNEDFFINCSYLNNSPKPFLRRSNIDVTSISLDGRLQVLNYVTSDCYKKDGEHSDEDSNSWSSMQISSFNVSNTENKFTVIGCDSYGYVQGYTDKAYSTGCISSCDNETSVYNGSCTGIGCCQIDIPKGLTEINVSAYSFKGHSNVEFNPCTYAFVTNKTQFSFSSTYLHRLPQDQYPLVLDWSITGNGQCEEANKSSSYACKENSECYVREEYNDSSGYLCRCKKGYQGNPYLSHGCQDIDECSNPDSNDCTQTCINEEGSYTCKCHEGFHGDGRKYGEGCIADVDLPSQFPLVKVALESCLFEILENHIVNDGNEEQVKEVAELAKICLNVKGEERPTMREVAMELDGLRMMHKLSWVNAELNPEETERLLHDNSDVYKYGDGSNTTAGYDSLKDHVLEVLDDGR
ncbi:hypothetical protein Patl1_08218 [Pistacia atlantica]|uniref:Uncharacterized protein n=1 Tax=Pistacia atlantica TaxID=434234 RepID=A0ACC1AGB4_9ROSI|nr:hypothetical protein Patl1_08218 [Pistacia atlantica]